jgi:cyclin-dependent kinase 7
MDHYKVIGELGRGTWGVVHEATQISTGRIVAIKKIKSVNPEEGVNFTAVREIKLLREFKHENVIELVDVFPTPDQAVCLVYERAFTDLEKIINDKSIPISLADIKKHLQSLLQAISACHDRWILHRDLKPDNLLFMTDGSMKLADFGLARMYGTPKQRLSPQAITLWYKPPEMLLGAYEYSSAADMWSVGCIFAELLLRRPFMPGNNSDISQLDIIFSLFGTPNETNWPDHKALPLCTRGLLWDDVPGIPFSEIFTAAPKDAISLLRSILALDPNMRFTALQSLSHPYFTNDPPPTPKEKLVLEGESK